MIDEKKKEYFLQYIDRAEKRGHWIRILNTKAMLSPRQARELIEEESFPYSRIAVSSCAPHAFMQQLEFEIDRLQRLYAEYQQEYVRESHLSQRSAGGFRHLNLPS